MARHRFGSTADYVITVGDGDAATLVPGATVTCWNTPSGGTQYTDLLAADGSTPILGGALTADTNGAVPEFYGPDAVGELYLDAAGGEGPRRRTLANDLGTSVAQVAMDLGAHQAATDPHGDRAYADDLVAALDAADVDAIPTSAAGAANGIAQLGADSKVLPAQLPTAPVTSVNGETGAVTLNAADVGAEAAGTAVLLTGTQTVAGAKTFSSVPSSSAAPTTDNHLTRKTYVDTLVGGSWLPADVGFAGWTFDPALTSDSGQNLLAGYVYLCGIILRVPTTLNSVAFYSCGYAGGSLNANSFAGLYTSAGSRVALTSALNGIFTANDGVTVTCPLTSSYSAAAGKYWVAIVTNGQTASPYNGPVLARGASVGTNPAGSAAASGQFRRHARLTTTGQTSLPSSFNPATGLTYDANAIWAAVAS